MQQTTTYRCDEMQCVVFANCSYGQKPSCMTSTRHIEILKNEQNNGTIIIYTRITVVMVLWKGFYARNCLQCSQQLQSRFHNGLFCCCHIVDSFVQSMCCCCMEQLFTVLGNVYTKWRIESVSMFLSQFAFLHSVRCAFSTHFLRNATH